MMNQYEAAGEIIAAIPECTEEITAVINMKNPFVMVKIFTGHIQRLVEVHNEVMIEKSLKVMSRIYDRGDTLLKNAVENVFIFSFDRVVSRCTKPERKIIFGMMPMALYTLYVNQIYKSGI